MIIGVQNLSTLVSNQDAYAMSMLVNRQARDHVAPAWGMLPPTVRYLPQGAQGERHDAIIAILDDADQAGDLGWHADGPDAAVYGRVFARPVLGAGGNALTASLSVCSVLSHEVAEVLGDAACDAWRQRGNGDLVAQELCDPVEGDSYLMTIEAPVGASLHGTVSDFVFPSWFDENSKPQSSGYMGSPLGFDWMGVVLAPFQVRQTGYLIVMSGGTVTEQWGEDYPAWRRLTKAHPASRTSRRDSLPPRL